jgi:hypothetical protein
LAVIILSVVELRRRTLAKSKMHSTIFTLSVLQTRMRTSWHRGGLSFVPGEAIGQVD